MRLPTIACLREPERFGENAVDDIAYVRFEEIISDRRDGKEHVYNDSPVAKRSAPKVSVTTHSSYVGDSRHVEELSKISSLPEPAILDYNSVGESAYVPAEEVITEQ